MSTPSAIFLGIGIGFAGSYAFNLACALVLAWWSEERLRADQL